MRWTCTDPPNLECKNAIGDIHRVPSVSKSGPSFSIKSRPRCDYWALGTGKFRVYLTWERHCSPPSKSFSDLWQTLIEYILSTEYIKLYNRGSSIVRGK
jgi:hypothetical protein